jgi:hypothetical protein
MSKLNRVLGGALLALALLGGQMARADDDKTVSLLVKPTLGRVTHKKIVIKTSVMGMDIVVNQAQQDTVKEVKENGDVVVEIVDEGSTLNIGGVDRDQPTASPHTVTRDKVGKVKEVKDADASGFMTPEVSKLVMMIATSILTDKAVKTNDTWQTELDNPAVKEKKVTVKDTFLGVDKVEGKDYWKIKQTAEAVVDTDGSKMSYEITEWIDPVNGDAFKIEGTIKDVPTQVGAITMQITSKSVKAGEKSKADDKTKAEPAKP